MDQHAFLTTDGTRYELVITMGTVKRVLEETGFKLTDIFADEKASGELFGDNLKFCAVLASVVRPALDAAGKTVDQFFETTNGEVMDRATVALLGALTDFFQEPRKGLLKRILAAVLKQQERADAALSAAVEKQIVVIDAMSTPMSSDSSSRESAA